jgi:polyisoprenoid-binding protein YceI
VNTTDPLKPDSAHPGRWRLANADSTAEFRVPHFWGLITVRGRFQSLDGWLEIDSAGFRQLELSIDASSVHTGNPMRDRHLRGADFFDVSNHPELRFHSTRVTRAGDGVLKVAGELAAAGHQVPLELEASLTRSNDQLRIDVSTPLDQRLLGISWSPLAMTRSPVMLKVSALLRPES